MQSAKVLAPIHIMLYPLQPVLNSSARHVRKYLATKKLIKFSFSLLICSNHYKNVSYIRPEKIRKKRIDNELPAIHEEIDKEVLMIVTYSLNDPDLILF